MPYHIWFQQALNKRSSCCTLPRAILRDVFLAYHILLSFHSPKGTKYEKISCRIWETWKIVPINYFLPIAAKPLNSRNLRILKNLSVIKSCPLLKGSLTKIVTFRTKHFVRYARHVPLFGMSAIGRFHWIKTGFIHGIITRKPSMSGSLNYQWRF